jgi:hypothetical protein
VCDVDLFFCCVPSEGVLLGQECPVRGHRTKDSLRGCGIVCTAAPASLFASPVVWCYCFVV